MNTTGVTSEEEFQKLYAFLETEIPKLFLVKPNHPDAFGVGERDADQGRVSELTDPEALRRSIETALAYAQGANTTCPTFFARRAA